MGFNKANLRKFTMSLNFFDFRNGTTIQEGLLENIPHVQGVYLLFDTNGEFIYVGKGWGDDRVKSHFDKNRKDDYFYDACYWMWLPAFDENEAFAYEKAVYDVHCQLTGQPPKHNEIAPPGIPSAVLFRIEKIKEQCAQEGWINFLATVIDVMYGDYK